MSTLQVENLIGPTSGSNANTVLIPSGQTLHAPGHVIQMQTATFAGNGNTTTSTSFMNTGVTVNITPQFSTSKILVIVHQVVGISEGSSHARVDFKCIESGGTEIYRMDFHGADGTAVATIQKNMSGSGVFQCSNTNQLTFKTQLQKAGGSASEAGSIYYFWYTESKHTITALEIAQ
tara:strand:- start:33 stop:563 length:531 start_codon:yes stop_codon:yes gene_type:complete